MTRISVSRRKKEVIVWSIAVLSDKTIVSGDSHGRLTFWDSTHGEQVKTMLYTWLQLKLILKYVSLHAVLSLSLCKVHIVKKLTPFTPLSYVFQIESFTTHKADVLSIAVSDDEHSLYCSGMDPTIINFVKVPKGEQASQSQWVKNVQRQIHEHDVKLV